MLSVEWSLLNVPHPGPWAEWLSAVTRFSSTFQRCKFGGGGFPPWREFFQLILNVHQLAVNLIRASRCGVGFLLLKFSRQFGLLLFEFLNLGFQLLHELLLRFAFLGSSLALLGFKTLLVLARNNLGRTKRAIR